MDLAQLHMGSRLSLITEFVCFKLPLLVYPSFRETSPSVVFLVPDE